MSRDTEGWVTLESGIKVYVGGIPPGMEERLARMDEPLDWRDPKSAAKPDR